MFTPYPIFNPFPWPTSLSRKQVQNLEACLFLGPFVILDPFPQPSSLGLLASGKDLKAGRVYFQTVLDFRPVSSAYWPLAGISNPEMVYFQTLLDFWPSPLACQPQLGSQSKRVYFQTLMGFQPIPSAYWPWGWDLKFGRVYFQTLVHFQPIP